MNEELTRTLLKPPAQINKDMKRFQKTAKVLSSEHPRLIREYPDEWIALLDGKVVAHSAKFKDVLRTIAERGYSREQVIVRFIAKNNGTFILCAEL